MYLSPVYDNLLSTKENQGLLASACFRTWQKPRALIRHPMINMFVLCSFIQFLRKLMLDNFQWKNCCIDCIDGFFVHHGFCLPTESQAQPSIWWFFFWANSPAEHATVTWYKTRRQYRLLNCLCSANLTRASKDAECIRAELRVALAWFFQVHLINLHVKNSKSEMSIVM